jgi:hypothetical protein
MEVLISILFTTNIQSETMEIHKPCKGEIRGMMKRESHNLPKSEGFSL